MSGFAYYPEDLRRIADLFRRIADLCDGLNRMDDDISNNGVILILQNNIPVVDEHGTVYGHLADEVGGAWCFYPRGILEPEQGQTDGPRQSTG